MAKQSINHGFQLMPSSGQLEPSLFYFPLILPPDHPPIQEAWLYIVGRSGDSTSGPGPMYVFRAHICLCRFPMYMLWARSAVFNTRARQVMFGPIIRPNRLCPIYGFSAPPTPPLQNCPKRVIGPQRCLKLVIGWYSVPAGASETV